MNLPKISFVVIGHNEEAKIAACLQALFALNYPADKKEIIYVDNFSSDRSVLEASRFPIRILALQKDPPRPGLARNAGLALATGALVQFVDGDMEMDAQWLAHAVPRFQQSQVGCVVGRLQEEHPHATIYNAVLDFSWKLKELGVVGSPGGGGLFRRELVARLQGYDEAMRAGEEIDLGYKMRAAGFEIHRLPAVMAKHDADLRSFRQIWRRSLRDGYGEMQVIMKHWPRATRVISPLRGVLPAAQRNSERGILKDDVILENIPLNPPSRGERFESPLAGGVLRFLRDRFNFNSWPQGYVWKMNAQMGLFVLWAALLACTEQWLWLLLLCGVPPALVARKTLRYGRQAASWRVSFWYSFFLYALMLPILFGEIHCLWDRLRARYHTPGARPALRQRLRWALK